MILARPDLFSKSWLTLTVARATMQFIIERKIAPRNDIYPATILLKPILGGLMGVFYVRRHALKTYMRVRESSSKAMGGRAWAENVIQTI